MSESKSESKPSRPCFACDGSGQKCDVCGESEPGCRCGEDEEGDEPTYGECPDCLGTGVASADTPRAEGGPA